MRHLWMACLLASCASRPDGTAADTKIVEHRAAVYIAAEYDTVWEKLTTAEQFAGWFSMAGIAFPAEPGQEVTWGAAGRVMIRGTLRSIEKGRGFAHSFRFRGLGFDEEPASEVVWEVTRQGPVVLVRVRHTATGAPETMAMIGELGWAKSLNRLKTLLETGEPMPWPVDEPVRPLPLG